MAQEEADLVRQALAGDATSFGRLIGRHQGAAQSLAFHLAGGFADAQDIAQETFIAAYLKLGQLHQPACFAAWLRQLTLNCGRMWLRRRREHVSLDTVEAQAVAAAPSPAEAVERAETRRLVQRTLEDLSDDQRLVVVLYYLGGLDYARIAAFLEVPVSTVEGRLRRARTHLKGRLLTMIEDTLHDERLSPDFVPTKLEEALKRAREARQRWSSEEFIPACRQAMEAAVRREEVQAQIEVLGLLGEAIASWLGKGEQAVEHYTAAIALARDHQQTADEARLLKELVEVHGRHGHFEAMGASARQAQALFAGLGDRANQALMAAALELAELLPGRWQPGEPGGYAPAAFTVEHGPEGHSFRDPAWVRHYSCGCPARGAVLAHLLEPRRFLGPSLAPEAAWEDRLTGHRPDLTWGLAEENERFEDRCRVVSGERGTAWIASATVGVEPTPAEQREDITQRVALDRAMDDLEGEALSWSELVGAGRPVGRRGNGGPTRRLRSADRDRRHPGG